MLDTAPTIAELLTSPKPTMEPWLSVEAVANTEAVRDAAIAALNTAAKGDSSLTVPGTEARNRIDKMFSPESIKANLRALVDKGIAEGGLKFGRRVNDRVGALGLGVALSQPKLVSISDTTAFENIDIGGVPRGREHVDLEVGRHLGQPDRDAQADRGCQGHRAR